MVPCGCRAIVLSNDLLIPEILSIFWIQSMIVRNNEPNPFHIASFLVAAVQLQPGMELSVLSRDAIDPRSDRKMRLRTSISRSLDG